MEKAASMLASFLGGGGSPEPPTATVSSIFIYPIKSCRGISVPHAPITSTGFRWDRQWMVVNSNGRAYTQRGEPKLALVEVEVPADSFNEDWEPTENSYLVIRAPGMDTLKVPLNRKCAVTHGISVWEWSGAAFDEGSEASEWFSNYLGKPSRLVRFNATSEIRAVDPKYAQGHKTMFSDQYPFLLISQVPTINQENGIAGVEPTETLMKFRSDHALHLKGKPQGKVYFGQNLVCRESLSAQGKGKIVKVGDPVYVLEEVSSSADAAI
uniref:Mitochondrial amidoxime reducing component 2 isoform X2 n=1 Tax=Elaeis guineensis var. tenera TaxID=51953 RepID=A0A6I9QW99_ELAGV|nr:mitochondrial amidoxime reducing component 2 isoform X2 [Elaeis guineensis]